MARLGRVPPGRAGRLWLRHRLAVAERGAELLDQKLRILRDEAERLTLLTEGTAAAWTAASDEAALWLVRAALLGGERAVRPGLDQAMTQVELTWTSTIGVRHPGGATCTPGPDDVPDGPVADVHTAHRRALDAAVQHAVAETALRCVLAEATATRRRVRAIQDRWLPQLRSALAAVELALEEQERADAVRLRWSLSTSARARPHPPDSP